MESSFSSDSWRLDPSRKEEEEKGEKEEEQQEQHEQQEQEQLINEAMILKYFDIDLCF